MLSVHAVYIIALGVRINQIGKIVKTFVKATCGVHVLILIYVQKPGYWEIPRREIHFCHPCLLIERKSIFLQ